MNVFSALQLPHWLMIAGAILVVAGFLGLALTRNKEGPTTEPS